MKKVIGVLLLTLMSSGVYAEMVAGVGLTRLSDDDISYGLIQGAVGYKFEINESFSLVPELRAGFGVSDDTFAGVTVDLDSAYGAAVRGQFDYDKTYVWIAPSYSKIKLSGNFFGSSASITSDWEFGGGIGFGYRLSESMAVEASYEGIDGSSLLGVAARFSF